MDKMRALPQASYQNRLRYFSLYQSSRGKWKLKPRQNDTIKTLEWLKSETNDMKLWQQRITETLIY